MQDVCLFQACFLPAAVCEPSANANRRCPCLSKLGHLLLKLLTRLGGMRTHINVDKEVDFEVKSIPRLPVTDLVPVIGAATSRQVLWRS